jgi:hypothetical protein
MEMEELNEELDAEEFLQSCLVLYKHLDVGQRAELLNFEI